VTVSDEEVRAFYDAADPSVFTPDGASPGPKPPFEDVRATVREVLGKRKSAEQSQAFIRTLESRARVEKFL
jgi:hypothetical protein